jgi:AraC-like DNA-binding protein
MNLELRLENDFLNFGNGMPSRFSDYVLPQAQTKHSTGPWGVIGFQEIETPKYLLRHFLFYLHKSLSFHTREKNEGLQSLLSLKGELEYKAGDLAGFTLKEREYTLFQIKSAESFLKIPGQRVCSFINAFYTPAAYKDFLILFPQFKKELEDNARKKAHYFSFPPIPARYSVHDAIQAIWCDKYIGSLVKKHIEIRLENKLFTLLAQTYTTSPIAPTASERETAIAARILILQNIKIHLPPADIASKLGCTEKWLTKTFSKVHGMGMYHFLRKTRMELAKKKLLKGESLKAVAIDVGMKPSNFPKELRSYFGYTVTALKKGQV